MPRKRSDGPSRPSRPRPAGRTKRSKTPRRQPRRLLRRAVGLLAVAAVLGGALFVLRLDGTIRSRFEGRRWPLPARVYARPLELFGGERLSAEQLDRELQRLRYRPTDGAGRPGTYTRKADTFLVDSRPFTFWDGSEPARRLRIRFDGDAVATLEDEVTGRDLPLVRLDPPLIGSIYPAHGEDRVLVRLDEVPPLLTKALVAVEDRQFYHHHGIDPRAIGRAFLANLRAGSVVQGGSTLTQQLVKNYFLTSEQTLWRKAVEAAMALLLEVHYSKDEILQAYLNEIYLGQQASRSINGVGLASQFYFDRPAAELDLPRIALLVGLVRGPSYYDPRRHPERAKERRNLVLDILARQGVVTEEDAARAKQAPLGVTDSPQEGDSAYPAFLDLVQRQLRRDYREEDLRSEGLRIFTTLDPIVQEAAERSLADRLRLLEGRGGEARGLEGAVVVTHPDTGEVAAVVGGRKARYEGFNRALDARRPVGSLMKPAVYLTALESPTEYTLATRIDDGPVEAEGAGGSTWSPQNFDRQAHGPVTLYQALADSYNMATVRLGLALGVDRVAETARRLGLDRPLPPYPASFLGAVDLSPLEVAQMYQTLSSGGFLAPLRSIREVVGADGVPLRRYPIAVTQTVEPGPACLITAALQGVVREGTGRSLLSQVPAELAVAGKTGTSDDLRDSWFAAFTGDWLGVVWVGKDDNSPTGLTGATGALPVWGELEQRIGGRPVRLAPPDSVELVWVDRTTGLLSREGAENAVELPFLAGSAPQEWAPGAEPVGLWARFKGWLRRGKP